MKLVFNGEKELEINQFQESYVNGAQQLVCTITPIPSNFEAEVFYNDNIKPYATLSGIQIYDNDNAMVFENDGISYKIQGFSKNYRDNLDPYLVIMIGKA